MDVSGSKLDGCFIGKNMSMTNFELVKIKPEKIIISYFDGKEGGSVNDLV